MKSIEDRSSEIDRENDAMLSVQFSEFSEVAELGRDGAVEVIIGDLPERVERNHQMCENVSQDKTVLSVQPLQIHEVS